MPRRPTAGLSLIYHNDIISTHHAQPPSPTGLRRITLAHEHKKGGRVQAQHALITGGGSGIGLACARALQAEGVAISLVGRNEDKLRQAIATLGANCHYYCADVGDEEQIANAIEQANVQQPLTIAIANAGIGALSRFEETKTSDWRDVMQTNLDGTYFTFRHAGLALRNNGGGSLCAISSIAGLRTHRFMSAYCVSNAGIDMLVRNTADELGSANIRVNSVCPGLVDTEIASGLFATDAVHEDYLACMPLGRTGVVDDIAAAVSFLCGPNASWITGVNLPVDGGHHLRRGPNLDAFTA